VLADFSQLLETDGARAVAVFHRCARDPMKDPARDADFHWIRGEGWIRRNRFPSMRRVTKDGGWLVHSIGAARRRTLVFGSAGLRTGHPGSKSSVSACSSHRLGWRCGLRDNETDGGVTGPTKECPPLNDPDLGLNDFPDSAATTCR
jgi:hypothetical protein